MVSTVVDVAVTVSGGALFAPTLVTTQFAPPVGNAVPKVSVNSVPVVVAVPVVSVTVHVFAVEPVVFAMVCHIRDMADHISQSDDA